MSTKKKCFWRNNIGFKLELPNSAALTSLDSDSAQASLLESAEVQPVSRLGEHTWGE